MKEENKAEQEIKELAEEKRVSMYQISKDTGVDQGALSRYFSDKREMSANTYLKLKSYLDKL